MIEIIKKENKENKKYKITCTCGTIYTCYDTDRKIECFGHGDFDKVVHCPVCNEACFRPFTKIKYEEI